MRVILYTGKGGVGKTTVAAASAVRCARQGHRTLVISTDPAHSLGDSLDVKVGTTPTAIEKNLWAQEINALSELESHWEKIHTYLSILFTAQGVDDIVAEELASPPGMEEIASLMWIKRHEAEGKFDVVIVDCAPTGETLQLLAFPDVARWYLNRIFPIQRRMLKVARPMVQPFISIPLPSDDILGSAQDLLADLDGMKRILADPKRCSVRIVVNLEKMVVKEAQRAFTYLNLYNYLVDQIIVNRVLPDEVNDVYFAEWRKAQKRYSELVDAAFSPVPIVRTKLFDHEIIGLAHLNEMGVSIFADDDPATMFYNTVPQTVRKKGNGYELSLALPFVEKKDVSISHREDELFVSVGPYKREIALPRVLRGKVTTNAKLDDGVLRITFESAA